MIFSKTSSGWASSGEHKSNGGRGVEVFVKVGVRVVGIGVGVFVGTGVMEGIAVCVGRLTFKRPLLISPDRVGVIYFLEGKLKRDCDERPHEVMKNETRIPISRTRTVGIIQNIIRD